MKIIDLLNKIANGEEVPKKIKYEDTIFDYTKRNREGLRYLADEYSNYEDNDNYLRTHLFWHIENLNDEVEIIEEDKGIEKIPAFVTKVGIVDDGNIEKYTHVLFEQQEELYLKLNELIDKVNSLEKKQ